MCTLNIESQTCGLSMSMNNTHVSYETTVKTEANEMNFPNGNTTIITWVLASPLAPSSGYFQVQHSFYVHVSIGLPLDLGIRDWWKIWSLYSSNLPSSNHHNSFSKWWWRYRSIPSCHDAFQRWDIWTSLLLSAIYQCIRHCIRRNYPRRVTRGRCNPSTTMLGNTNRESGGPRPSQSHRWFLFGQWWNWS